MEISGRPGGTRFMDTYMRIGNHFSNQLFQQSFPKDCWNIFYSDRAIIERNL